MQKGHISRVGNCWLLRYAKPVIVDGKEVRKRCCKKLATYGDRYRTLADVQPLAAKFLAPINAGQYRAEATTPVKEFFTLEFLPSLKLHPATIDGYTRIWKILEPYCPDMVLGDVQTVDIQRWLNSAAGAQRAHTVNRSLKVVLSAGFKYARQSGAMDGNPVRDAAIPRGKPKEDRPAYTLEEFVGMLKVLGEPARTVVLLCGLTGLRRAELQGLKWEDFVGEEVLIQRAVWNGQESEAKTLASRAAVPVVPFLMSALEEHKARNSGTGWVFHNLQGKPVRLQNMADQIIRPALDKAGIEWRGYHPLRYAVGTILHSLGVDARIIQLILRHANVQTTLNFYVKPAVAERRAAMDKLEAALGKSLAREIA